MARRTGHRVYEVEGGLVADPNETITGNETGDGWVAGVASAPVGDGTAVPVALDSLAPGDPRAVTDWGPIINTAVAANAGSSGGLLLAAGPYTYPFTTRLNADNSVGVTIEGSGGMPWAGGIPAGQSAKSRLVFAGTGAAAAISARVSSGFTLRDLGVYYSSSSFTGKLFDFGGTSCVGLLERVHAGYSLHNHAVQTAHAIVGADGAVCLTIRDCGLSDAAWIVMGNEGSGGGASSFSNVIRIEGGVLSYATTALVGNIWQRWVLDGVTFEVETTPAVIDSTGGIYGSTFTVKDCWLGDMDGANRVMIRQRAGDVWHATFTTNDFYTVGGPIFDLPGGGAIHIVENSLLQTNDNGVIVNLGDVGAGATAKTAFTYRGNGGTVTATDAIINRKGHRNLNIDSNAASGGVCEVRTIGGYERVGHPDRRVLPTVVDGAGAVPGVGNAELVGASSDCAGIFKIYPQAAGRVARLTFGTPLAPDPEGAAAGHIPCIQITPLEINGGFDGAAGATAQPFVKVNETTQIDASGQALGFDLMTKNALATVCCFAYRVIQL